MLCYYLVLLVLPLPQFTLAPLNPRLRWFYGDTHTKSGLTLLWRSVNKPQLTGLWKALLSVWKWVLPSGAGSCSSGDGWSTSIGESSLWAAWVSDMDCTSDYRKQTRKDQRGRERFNNMEQLIINFFFGYGNHLDWYCHAWWHSHDPLWDERDWNRVWKEGGPKHEAMSASQQTTSVEQIKQFGAGSTLIFRPFQQ